MIATLINRLAVSAPMPVLAPAQNRFPSITISVDKCGQLAIACLHRLIAKDLADCMAFPPVEKHTECTAEELLRLRVILPCSDYESGLPDEHIVLSHSQYSLLKKYLGLELRWLATHQTSRLWDVHPMTLQMALGSLVHTLHRRTIILTWSELCKRSEIG